jgi:hypothetical protein
MENSDDTDKRDMPRNMMIRECPYSKEWRDKATGKHLIEVSKNDYPLIRLYLKTN